SNGKGALGCESWRADQRLSDYLRGQREAIRRREHRSVTGRGCRREDDARTPSEQREPDVRLCASVGSQVARRMGGLVKALVRRDRPASDEELRNSSDPINPRFSYIDRRLSQQEQREDPRSEASQLPNNPAT